jgi:hypothetical protein
MVKAINIKSLVLGATLAFAGVLAGEGLAHAECDYPERQDAYELAFSLAESSCDYAAQGWLEDAGVSEIEADSMYEACMRLSVPPMVLAPAQHYDTTDAAFWRTVSR